jgi:hypothetical protein
VSTAKNPPGTIEKRKAFVKFVIWKRLLLGMMTEVKYACPRMTQNILRTLTPLRTSRSLSAGGQE